MKANMYIRERREEEREIGQKQYLKRIGWEVSKTYKRYETTDLRSPIYPKQDNYKENHT